jgi:hypothetical protein
MYVDIEVNRVQEKSVMNWAVDDRAISSSLHQEQPCPESPAQPRQPSSPSLDAFDKDEAGSRNARERERERELPIPRLQKVSLGLCQAVMVIAHVEPLSLPDEGFAKGKESGVFMSGE